MRRLGFFLLIALAATSRSAAEPLEQPTVQTTVRVEREEGGWCSEVQAGKPGSAPGLRMTAICHGWSATTCADKLLVLGKGVMEDQAQVLLTEQNSAIDAVALVDKGIRARWPRDEHLHLMFGTPRCEGSAVVVRFSGSHLRANASGSATGFVGVLGIGSAKDQQVVVRPEGQAKRR